MGKDKGIPERLFCPECGLRLEKGKWPTYNLDFRLCQGRHLWEVSRGYGSGINFQREELKRCPCGEEAPNFCLRDGLCQPCHQKLADAWRMDAQESFAKLEITPILTLEGSYYQIETTIEIKPYPNPCMGGGSWGLGIVEGDDDLAEAIESFHAQADELKAKGLVRVEVERHDQETETTQPRMVEAKKVEAPKAETQQLSLI